MRKYHRQSQQGFKNLHKIDEFRLKKGLETKEADIDELIKFCKTHHFMHDIYLDYSKSFIREFGIKGYKLTPAVQDIIIQNLT